MEEHKFMRIVEKAIGQMSDETPLTEAIAEICEKENVDVEEMGSWIRAFRGLLQVMEINAKKHNLLSKHDIFNCFSIGEYF